MSQQKKNNDLKVSENSVKVERIGHLGKISEKEYDLFISYEADVLDIKKVSKYFIVMRYGKFAMSMDIKKDEIEAILAFMNEKGDAEEK